VKVVYHLNEGVEAGRARHDEHPQSPVGGPTAKIVVVAHGRGIDFLLKEAKTPGGTAFVTDVDELALRGVEFRVCRFTLERRSIEPRGWCRTRSSSPPASRRWPACSRASTTSI